MRQVGGRREAGGGNPEPGMTRPGVTWNYRPFFAKNAIRSTTRFE
jgi:hypothetical protein